MQKKLITDLSKEKYRGYYHWSKSDFRELLYSKYQPMEEVLWCLWVGEQPTDYLLCNWDSDLLPTLYKKDEIRFEYNQSKNKWSQVSCTIFAAVWMASDLTNYEFSYDEIREIDELSYTKGRTRGQWWYVQSAVKLVKDRWNSNEKLVKKYWKLAFYRISKYDDEIIEECINKLYTIDWNYCPTSEYNEDRRDWMVEGTNFWRNTNWHSVDIICNNWQRSVKDNFVWIYKYNIYGLKHKLSAITNFWPYFYIYTLVNEDNLEEIKRLNELKSKIVQVIELNSQIWHLVNDSTYKKQLNEMNNANRKKLNDINNELKKY